MIPHPDTLDGWLVDGMHQVRIHAHFLKKRIPHFVLTEDLIGDGMLGLAKALRTFDPSRGIKFTSYSERRINGAMLDGLRDWNHSRMRSERPAFISIDSAPDPQIPCPQAAAFYQRERARLIHRAIRRLPRRERIIVICAHWHGWDQPRIGRVLGLGPSRVSQLQSTAMIQLGKALLNDRYMIQP